jgi:hypothetical protein
MKEFIRHHTTRKVRTRDLLEILPRRGPEVFHAFCCTLLSLKRDDLDVHLRKYICCVPNNVQHRLCSPKYSAVVPNVLVER